MKEFAIKHPILTFLLVDSAIAGVVNVLKIGLAAFGKNKVIERDPFETGDIAQEKEEE